MKRGSGRQAREMMKKNPRIGNRMLDVVVKVDEKERDKLRDFPDLGDFFARLDLVDKQVIFKKMHVVTDVFHDPDEHRLGERVSFEKYGLDEDGMQIESGSKVTRDANLRSKSF